MPASSGSCVIVVTAFLWSFLRRFRHCCSEFVYECSRAVHRALKLPDLGSYNLEEWIEKNGLPSNRASMLMAPVPVWHLHSGEHAGQWMHHGLATKRSPITFMR